MDFLIKFRHNSKLPPPFCPDELMYLPHNRLYLSVEVIKNFINTEPSLNISPHRKAGVGCSFPPQVRLMLCLGKGCIQSQTQPAMRIYWPISQSRQREPHGHCSWDDSLFWHDGHLSQRVGRQAMILLPSLISNTLVHRSTTCMLAPPSSKTPRVNTPSSMGGGHGRWRDTDSWITSSRCPVLARF